MQLQDKKITLQHMKEINRLLKKDFNNYTKKYQKLTEEYGIKNLTELYDYEFEEVYNYLRNTK